MTLFTSLFSHSGSRPEIDEVRERLLRVLLWALSACGILPVIISVFRALEDQQPVYAVLAVVLFVPLVLAAVLRNRLSYRVRGGILIAAGLSLSLTFLLRLGLSGLGVEMFIVCTVLATVLFGIRLGLVCLGISILALAGTGVGMVHGFLPTDVDLMMTSRNGVAWFNITLLTTIFSAVLMLSPEVLRRRLEQALGMEQQKTRDLTAANEALQEAERATRKSEQRFRELAELLPESVFETDLSARLTFVNEAGFRTFGYGPAELEKGFTALEMLDPSEHERAMKQIVLALKGEDLELREYLARRKDGTTFPVLIRSSLIQVDGQPAGIRGFIIDISEKKQVEAQFHVAQRMEAVGTLAGGIAHDFNNLLTGIQGRVSILQKRPGSPEQQEKHLISIEDHIESAASLTRQLLGLARGGKYETHATDLNDLLEKTLEMFGRTHKELTTELELERAIWRTEVDRNQIEQVLLNLLLNASQAMPRGGELFLRTRNVDLEASRATALNIEPGFHVEISIRDSGVGIDETTLSHIFEPFFTTKGPGRGTGLGLASAYGIVHNHGGAIDVESQAGEGSTFRILLPAKNEIAPRITPPPSDALPGGKETVLIVDDEELILKATSPLLKMLGYTVLTARSGTLALEILGEQEDAVDLVILDLIMPELSGGATYERMQTLSRRPKVLLSSGFSAEGAANELLASGCEGFLQKPYRIEQLARKVRNILDEIKN